MKRQNLKLADNTQQAVKQEISRISALFEVPEIWGKKQTTQKTILNMSPPTLVNKTYPKPQNMTETQIETKPLLVHNCPGQTFLTSNLGQYTESVQADMLTDTRPLQSSSSNEQ